MSIEWCGVNNLSLIFRVHALQRMVERHIREADVQHVLDTGTTIESYPDDQPYPSRLVLGWVASRPIHVVIADAQALQETIVITVYEPDPERWETDYQTRKPR